MVHMDSRLCVSVFSCGTSCTCLCRKHRGCPTIRPGRRADARGPTLALGDIDVAVLRLSTQGGVRARFDSSGSCCQFDRADCVCPSNSGRANELREPRLMCERSFMDSPAEAVSHLWQY